MVWGNWQPRNPTRPYDDVFLGVGQVAPRCKHHFYTTDECLRILAANGFRNPEFQFAGDYCWSHQLRCLVIGPDGEKYDGREVLDLIFRAERLERLCRDHSDAVMGMLRRQKE